MTDHEQNPNHDTAAQPVQPGMSGTSNEGISPEGNFSTHKTKTDTTETTDIEGSSIRSDQEKQIGGFVGSEGTTDTSSELVEDGDKDDHAPDGE